MKRTAENGQSRKTQPLSTYLQQVLRKAQQLVIYRDILQDPIVTELLQLLETLSREPKPARKSLARIRKSYAQFFSYLAAKTRTGSEPAVGSALQNHLLDLILAAENAFSCKAQSSGLEELGRSLLRQVELDLSKLQELYHLDADQLLTAMQKADDDAVWLNWDQLEISATKGCGDSLRFRTKRQFHESADWKSLLAMLADHYSRAGCGIFGQYRAFHWKRTAAGSLIDPIVEPDAIRMEELIGCEDQKTWLIRNTSHFLAGHASNNVFVYGDRGTGKSSAIKALINHFPDPHFKMIEISRDDLDDLPDVMKQVRSRPERFILFVDDLSFEEGETQYKTLKAVLEGSLEARPRNVLVYATSNRRHLIKEYFSDRNHIESEEVRHQDTLQEKVSLADRFGIQLIFVTPDQNEYLAIVRSMAQRRNLNLPEEELRQRALQWVQFHNARSGRTARQFIDDLAAELQTQDHTFQAPDSGRKFQSPIST